MLGLDVPSSDESDHDVDAEVSQSRMQVDPDQQDSISRPVNQLDGGDIDIDEIEIEDNDYVDDTNMLSRTQPLKLGKMGKKLAP